MSRSILQGLIAIAMVVAVVLTYGFVMELNLASSSFAATSPREKVILHPDSNPFKKADARFLYHTVKREQDLGNLEPAAGTAIHENEPDKQLLELLEQ